jgi:hypothetical protein
MQSCQQHDAALVAEFVEVVALVAPAAPDPQAVHVRFDCRVEEAGDARAGPARRRASAGIQFAPFAKISLPFTTNLKLRPTLSSS